MKNNLMKALLVPPTLSEMVVIALYSQAISHSYMYAVCEPAAKDINMLNLDPLHAAIDAQ